MLPVFQIEVPSYAFFATIGLVCAVLFTYFRIDKAKITFKQYLWCLGSCAIGALIGARLLFVIAMLPQIEITTGNICYYLINGGIVFYGGMLGLILGVFAYSKVIHKEFQSTIDIIAPAIPLFHFFARIGCLFAGCCYGVQWNWGVIMADSPDVIRFPVQFFESICNALIFIIIMVKERRHKTSDGNIIIYLILYAVCRFILEFFRGDSIRGIWTLGLSTAQIISLIILLFIFIYTLKRQVLYKKH